MHQTMELPRVQRAGEVVDVAAEMRHQVPTIQTVVMRHQVPTIQTAQTATTGANDTESPANRGGSHKCSRVPETVDIPVCH